MVAAVPAAGVEITQLEVVVVRAARAAPEQLLRVHLNKVVVRVAREDHRAFLEVLLFMLLAVVVV
jgi:hypothetical protein